MLAALVLSCLLALPRGDVTRGFVPEGPYGGHWGIDVVAEVGSPVRAAAAGIVTYSGVVAGNETVTIHHGGGIRTSYSYLSGRSVSVGDRVTVGTVLGFSGVDHGTPAIHVSLRIGDRYVDPAASCRAGVPGQGVRLAPAVATYPVARAPRSARRDLRPAPSRPSHRR